MIRSIKFAFKTRLVCPFAMFPEFISASCTRPDCAQLSVSRFQMPPVSTIRTRLSDCVMSVHIAKLCSCGMASLYDVSAITRAVLKRSICDVHLNEPHRSAYSVKWSYSLFTHHVQGHWFIFSCLKSKLSKTQDDFQSNALQKTHLLLDHCVRLPHDFRFRWI